MVFLSRSHVDTLLHVLNRVVIDRPQPDSQVTTTEKFLSRLKSASEGLHTGFQAILTSSEYIYINDLTNTMKHRELVESTVVYSSSGSAIFVQGFEKDRRFHDHASLPEPAKSCDALFEKLRIFLLSISNILTDAYGEPNG